MDIENLSSSGKLKEQKKIEIKLLAEEEEFRQLLGHLHRIRMFETDLLKEHSWCIQSGAKHNRVRYFVVPVKLRKKYKTTEYDYKKLSCGTIESKDDLFYIYKVPKKMIVKGIKKQPSTEYDLS